MKTKVLLSVAGLAACGAADAQVRPEIQTAEFSGQVHKAVRATAITGLTVDGQYVYGQTIELGQGNTNRITGTIAYDAAQLDDTDLDGLDIDPVCAELAPHSLTGASSRYWFGADFSWQAYAEDIIPASGTEGGTITEFVFLGSNALCDGGAGTTSEVLQVVLESWEGFDNFPDLDGSDGEFGDTPDGLGFPASQSDTDGDTFVDEFLGGIILTYADTDTDGDTVPDEQLSAGAAGYGIFYATGLDVLDTPLTSNLDMWAGGNAGTDGRPDGGVRLLWTRGDGGDGLGPLNGGLYPSSKAASMLWGTLAMQGGAGGCAPTFDPTGFGAGDSDGTVWGEGEDICGDGLGGWSVGAPSGNEAVDEQYDTTFDIADWAGGFVPDFPNALGIAFRINVVGGVTTEDCCDANADGACTPADFSAWVAAFNSAGARCDVNQDGSCTPADFSAWVAAFNASTGGAPLDCTF